MNYEFLSRTFLFQGTSPSQKSQTASTRKKPGFAQTVAAALPLADITTTTI